jgi:hypothetical protein
MFARCASASRLVAGTAFPPLRPQRPSDAEASWDTAGQDLSGPPAAFPQVKATRAQEGGGCGIRTHEDVAALAVFKTAAIGH